MKIHDSPITIATTVEGYAMSVVLTDEAQWMLASTLSSWCNHLSTQPCGDGRQWGAGEVLGLGPKAAPLVRAHPKAWAPGLSIVCLCPQTEHDADAEGEVSISFYTPQPLMCCLSVVLQPVH